MNTEQFFMFKIPLSLILRQDLLTISPEQNQEYVVAQSTSPLLDQIERLRGCKTDFVQEIVLVEAKKNPKKEEELRNILKNGFFLNGIHYERFGKSASQGKAGITVFVDSKIAKELYRITQMDIDISECVISKYEAQRCLLFSSCTLVKDYIPNIVIIGEYEKVLHDQWIRYVVQRKKDFTDKDGIQHEYNAREIEEGYHDIKLSPFDGCGCHELEFSEKISQSIGLDYTAIGAQIRMPFMKGYSVYVPFKKFFRELGITQIKDVYGHSHDINNIDCIWNTSMFKGNGIFKAKYGDQAWIEYMNTFRKYQFKLGISKYSHHIKDLNLKARMNYQYLQCLDLQNPKYLNAFNNHFSSFNILDESNQGEIINLAKYTTNLFQRVILGDKFYTLKFMGVHDTDQYDPVGKYMEACMINDTMLQDPVIKRYIYRKLKKSIV